MARALRYNIVDVFTDVPLTGNPLAVFTKGQGLSERAMQSIAREMNLSETAFLLPPEAGGHVRVRIFTPHTELPFAGHPVLGSAWVLAKPMEIPVLRLETQVGIIEVEMERIDGRLDLGKMNQPLPQFEELPIAEQLYSALGCEGHVDPSMSVTQVKNGPTHLLVEVTSKQVLDGLSPDFSRLARLVSRAGVYVYALEEQVCFARYFAPAFGINEDPATGSAAGPLGAYLVLRGRIESGRRLMVHQGQAMGRPSVLLVEARAGVGEVSSVKVAGRAIVVARGELLI